jgi:hypothetical protein
LVTTFFTNPMNLKSRPTWKKIVQFLRLENELAQTEFRRNR